MSDDYFELLINLMKTSSMLKKSLSTHITTFGMNINDSQIIILHSLEKAKGYLSYNELQENTFRFVYTNCNYAVSSLIKNKCIIKKFGSELGMDKRASFLYITSYGSEIYKKICKYAENQIIELKQYKEWHDKSFETLSNHLTALQEFIKKDL